MFIVHEHEDSIQILFNVKPKILTDSKSYPDPESVSFEDPSMVLLFRFIWENYQYEAENCVVRLTVDTEHFAI